MFWFGVGYNGKGRLHHHQIKRMEPTNISLFWTCFSQGLVWISLPFYPVGSVFCALFLFVNFKFERIKLTTLRARPVEKSSDKEMGKTYFDTDVVLRTSIIHTATPHPHPQTHTQTLHIHTTVHCPNEASILTFPILLGAFVTYFYNTSLAFCIGTYLFFMTEAWPCYSTLGPFALLDGKIPLNAVKAYAKAANLSTIYTIATSAPLYIGKQNVY